MERTCQVIEGEPDHVVEIVIHIAETLEEHQRTNFIAALENDDRINSVNFCPKRYHLLLVRYDRDWFSSQDVLASIVSQKVNAKLVGPV
jgi:hypothetical protein